MAIPDDLIPDELKLSSDLSYWLSPLPEEREKKSAIRLDPSPTTIPRNQNKKTFAPISTLNIARNTAPNLTPSAVPTLASDPFLGTVPARSPTKPRIEPCSRAGTKICSRLSSNGNTKKPSGPWGPARQWPGHRRGNGSLDYLSRRNTKGYSVAGKSRTSKRRDRGE